MLISLCGPGKRNLSYDVALIIILIVISMQVCEKH